MIKTIQSLFEHGILRPLEPIEGMRENTVVEIIIAFKQKAVSPILRFAGILSEEEERQTGC